MTLLRYMLSWVCYLYGDFISHYGYEETKLGFWRLSEIIQGPNSGKYWPWGRI